MLRGLLLCLLVVLCVVHAVRGDEPNAKPNVVFIIADDLTAEALSCYGNKQCQTPNIDRLAARGTRFTRAYTQYPVCGPSRAAIMSGMYPQAIGVTGNGGAARFTKNLGDRPSMAQHFKQHGYHTARVSKIYHMRVPGDITAGVDGPDHAASWTERFNCKAPEWMTAGEHALPTTQKVRKQPDQHYGLGFGTAFYIVKAHGDGAEQADARAADKAVELIETHRGGPFFLAVGFVRPHVPLVAPASFYEPYPPEKVTLPESVDHDWRDIPKAGMSLNSQRIGLAGRDDAKRKVIAAYYASVAFMDAQVGRVLDALDRHGLRDNTIVVFTSDHGYHLGEHDLWQKMSLHEQSARIPLIVAAPGLKPNTTAALAEQIDIYPTLAALAGLAVPEHCKGHNLAPVMAEPTKAVRDAAYCLKGKSHLLRTDRWAYIHHTDTVGELYDMHRDPGQFTNLYGDEAHRRVVLRLHRQLKGKLSIMQE